VKLSKRSQVEPFRVMEVMAAANQKARTGAQVYHLEVGQPSTPAPALALDAARHALGTMTLGYTEALGQDTLRERIARYYRDRFGLAIAPQRVVVTTGSSAAFVLAFLLALDAGQRLAIANPGYPAYRNIARALDLEVEFLPSGPAEGFRVSAAQVAACSAAAVLIASPSNPCGTVIPPHEMARIAEVCRTRGLTLISDEIYHGLTYDCRADTALAHHDGAITINSFSKYFSMTGWRIGWMIVPESAIAAVERLAQNIYISPPAISQVAACAALDAGEELDGHVLRYRRNRDRLLEGLRAAGFRDIAPADGAFYLYAATTPFGMASPEFARRLLEATGVAATPGIDFDPVDGQDWIRFSYAGTEAGISAAAGLIASWCAGVRRA
jgi:aspartate/methionine/tyrosine aminotransferase